MSKVGIQCGLNVFAVWNGERVHGIHVGVHTGEVLDGNRGNKGLRSSNIMAGVNAARFKLGMTAWGS